VDFLLVLIELFSLNVTAEMLRASIGPKSAILLQQGQVDTKFQVERVAPTNHSPQKTRLNDLSCVIKIWTDFSSVFFIIYALDRQTDGHRTRPPCIHCSTVKIHSARSYDKIDRACIT